MDPQYNHKLFEGKIYKSWENSGAFKPNSNKKTFSIIMPPPNANDPLHIGHAMFISIEDILIRFHRMLGESILWLPGTDHAGIETQFVFEKKLSKKDESRFDYDRSTLYKMIWDYVKENSGVAVDQMKQMGASADWSRFKFTLDSDVVKFVQNTFIKMHNDNLIYKGERLVNYCTKCGTGYSELEVEHQEETAKLYFIKYGSLTLATTRPETKFADTAVAVNPKDKRYKHLVGKEIIVEGLNGQFKLKVISDNYVDPEFGTGVVKITPYHDFNDFEVWMRHKNEIPKPKTVIDRTGRLTEVAGKYAGLKIKAAREIIEKDLENKGLLDRPTESYVHNVGVCYRCKTILEPLPLTQFFINTKPLVTNAIKALDNKETIILGAGQEKILRHWLTNIKDWNISRQIVWGIRIPIWYDVKGHEQRVNVSFIDKNKKQLQGPLSQFEEEFGFEYIVANIQQIEMSGYQGKNGPKMIASISKPDKQGKWIQETDTFDTWFSSGQWPVVTLATNEKEDFKKFYPTSVMETGYDILPIWVMRMMLLCIYLEGKSPFGTVYLHGLVRDDKGRKMSKSIGNVINPLEVIDKYGADALRFALIMSSTPAQDKNVGENTFRGMRNFSNKIWNAARFVKDFNNNVESDPVFDHWYMQEFPKHITKLLKTYRIGLAAEELYNDFWHKFCDIEIERAKKGQVSSKQLKKSLNIQLKLLHPFMPFVTEACWKELGHKELLMVSKWPQA